MLGNGDVYKRCEELGAQNVREMLIKRDTMDPVFCPPGMSMFREGKLKVAETWLSEYDLKQKQLHSEKQIDISKESNKIAQESNEIARQAQKASRFSNTIALAALVLSLCSLIVSLWK